MPIPEHVHRFWRALDDRLGHVEPTRWGAVVTDPRCPDIWDANYARIDEAPPDLTLSEVAEALLPALDRVGTSTFHVVSFRPEETTGLLAELSSLGHMLTWDLVMDLSETPEAVGTVAVEELSPGPELWERARASMGLFGVDAHAADQLVELERTLAGIGAKRWFGVRDGGGTVVSLGALVQLDGVGHLDNVSTFPKARGRGLASAIVARVVQAAHDAGAERVCLFADPDDEAIVRMYERLGFRGVGHLPATRGPIEDLRRA